MPSAPPFEKGVVGGVPLGHLAMKSALAHKWVGIYRLTSLLKGLISFGLPFQGYEVWLVFQRRRDHHQQSREAEATWNHWGGSAWGGIWSLTWGRFKNQAKPEQGCPVTSCGKAAGRQQGAPVSTELCCPGPAGNQPLPCHPCWLGSSSCRMKNWSEVAASASYFQGTGRRDQERGGDREPGSQVAVIMVILLGLEWGNWRFHLGRAGEGGGTSKRLHLDCPLINCPSGQSRCRTSPIGLLAAIPAWTVHPASRCLLA